MGDIGLVVLAVGDLFSPHRDSCIRLVAGGKEEGNTWRLSNKSQTVVMFSPIFLWSNANEIPNLHNNTKLFC